MISCQNLLNFFVIFFLLAFLLDGISYFFLPLFFLFHLKHRCIFSQYLIWNAFLSSKETLIVWFFLPAVIRTDHIKLSEFKYQLTLLKSKAIFQLDKSPWFLIWSHITKLAAFEVLLLKIVVLYHQKSKKLLNLCFRTLLKNFSWSAHNTVLHKLTIPFTLDDFIFWLRLIPGNHCFWILGY